jgi:hypothetical protein
LANRRPEIRAADLLTVQTLASKALCVLLLITRATRARPRQRYRRPDRRVGVAPTG